MAARDNPDGTQRHPVRFVGMDATMTWRRTRPNGVRMALGAGRRDVRRLVLRDTLTLVVFGVAIGIPAALAGARLLAAFLYSVTPNDPVAMTLAVATLAAAALVAGSLPARRAARVDPAIALRAE